MPGVSERRGEPPRGFPPPRPLVGYDPKRRWPHFSRAASRTSLLETATRGKRSRHSKGRVASIRARELRPFWPGGMIGSSGPDHIRRMTSMSFSGSERVQSAHSTSHVFVGSM
jgi:hypothetical protein